VLGPDMHSGEVGRDAGLCAAVGCGVRQRSQMSRLHNGAWDRTRIMWAAVAARVLLMSLVFGSGRRSVPAQWADDQRSKLGTGAEIVDDARIGAGFGAGGT